jgi:hypothetical protein
VAEGAMRMHNLLSLPHLLAKHIRGKKPLIGYSKSHIVTFDQYLIPHRRSHMGKITTKEIRKVKSNKYDDNY